MKRSLGLVAAITMSISLMACSGGTDAVDASQSKTDSTQSNTDASTLYPAGPFELTSATGAKVSFDLPSSADDERIADVEKFRTDTNASPVSYIIADVDNRKGTERVDLTITAFDADGRKYSFSPVSDSISEWEPYYSEDHEYVMPDGSKLAEDVGSELSDRGTDLYNKYLMAIEPAARGTVVLVSVDEDLPTEFARVALSSSGNAAEDATPVGKNGSK